MRLSLYFDIDRFRFQLFVEFHNLTNKTSLANGSSTVGGGIYSVIDQRGFGNPLAAGDPRRVQLGARFDF